MKYQIPTPTAFIVVARPSEQPYGLFASEVMPLVDRIAGMTAPNVVSICDLTADMRRPLIHDQDYDTAALLLAKAMEKYRRGDPPDTDWVICTPFGYIGVNSKAGRFGNDRKLLGWSSPMVVERRIKNRGSYSYSAIIDSEYIRHGEYFDNTSMTYLGEANEESWFKLSGKYPSASTTENSKRYIYQKRAAEIVAAQLDMKYSRKYKWAQSANLP